MHWCIGTATSENEKKRCFRHTVTGGFSRAIFESGALDVLKRFVDSVGGIGYQIPAPAMVAEHLL